MARIGDIGDSLDDIADQLRLLKSNPGSTDDDICTENSVEDGTPYVIGHSDRTEDSVCLPIWVSNNSQDQAVKVRVFATGY
jgi:hypothetical protein